MDPEKLYRRLYSSFAEGLEKTEPDKTGLNGEDNTQKEADNGRTGRG
jgi:hypothetical protein